MYLVPRYGTGTCTYTRIRVVYKYNMYHMQHRTTCTCLITDVSKVQSRSTVGVKNGDASVPFRPVQMPLHSSCQPFRMHAYIISNWVLSFDVHKKESQLVELFQEVTSS